MNSDEKINKIFEDPVNQPKEEQKEEWLSDYEGQLAIDAYQTSGSVIIKAPIAGVNPDDLNVSITDKQVIIKGERKEEKEVKDEDYFFQECYWGAFSRVFDLPENVNSEKAKATLKNGVLTITIPKVIKSQARTIKIESE